MPCLTTPEENGRTPPHAGVPKEAWDRWSKDGQKYAPWHYDKSAMVTIGDKLSIPPPELKEEMHQLPRGYTDKGASPIKRATMLGNGWHVGCARAAIFMTLLSANMEQAKSIPQNPHPFGGSKIEIMVNGWRHAGTDWGPAPGSDKRLIPETSDLAWHFQHAMKIVPPTVEQVELDPMVALTYDQLQVMGATILTWREEITQEIQEIIERHYEQTLEWWGQRKPHVQKAYRNLTRTRSLRSLSCWT